MARLNQSQGVASRNPGISFLSLLRVRLGIPSGDYYRASSDLGDHDKATRLGSVGRSSPSLEANRWSSGASFPLCYPSSSSAGR
jgi:hypothetical protein